MLGVPVAHHSTCKRSLIIIRMSGDKVLKEFIFFLCCQFLSVDHVWLLHFSSIDTDTENTYY